MKNNVGSNLTIIRRRRMWTQIELAKAAGVSPTTVSGIESGRISNPHFGTLRKLARALGVDPRELSSPLERKESQRPEPLSLEWARSSSEEEFERRLEEASLESLDSLSRELNEEQNHLQELYGEFPRGSAQRRFVKRQLRDVAAQSESVATSAMFHQDTDSTER